VRDKGRRGCSAPGREGVCVCVCVQRPGQEGVGRMHSLMRGCRKGRGTAPHTLVWHQLLRPKTF